MPFPFFKFPRELRDKVYEELLINERNIDSDLVTNRFDRNLCHFSGRPRLYGFWTEPDCVTINIHLAILFTCRTCAAEGTRILYGQNRFYLPESFPFRVGIVTEKYGRPLAVRRPDTTRDLNDDQQVFAKYRSAWSAFNHLAFSLDSGSRVQAETKDILAVIRSGFPNVHSLLIETRVGGSYPRDDQCILVFVALGLFESFPFHGAVYRQREIKATEVDFSYKILSATLFTTAEVQKVQQPAFFLDTKAMDDLVHNETLSQLLKNIFYFHLHDDDEIDSATTAALDIFDAARAAMEKRTREKVLTTSERSAETDVNSDLLS